MTITVSEREALERVRQWIEDLSKMGEDAIPEPMKHIVWYDILMVAALAERATVEPTEAMVNAAIAFHERGSYLQHPNVRPFRGTENGDTEGAWTRDWHIDLCRAILAAAPDAGENPSKK